MVRSLPGAAFFLDYDGTLTPIVSRPELAALSESTRATLSRLAKHRLVAVISGRGLADVRTLVGIDGLYYAGSHGFEIAGPGDTKPLTRQGTDYVSEIDDVEARLRGELGDIDGILLERKLFSVAVHFRLAPPRAEDTVSDLVDTILAQHPGLRATRGKKVVEIQPDLDWDKGRAVEWLLERLGIDPGLSLVIYVGDDLTDEDAFRALSGRGVGIVVREASPRETYADLALEDPEEVRVLLDSLAAIGDEESGIT